MHSTEASGSMWHDKACKVDISSWQVDVLVMNGSIYAQLLSYSGDHTHMNTLFRSIMRVFEAERRLRGHEKEKINVNALRRLCCVSNLTRILK